MFRGTDGVCTIATVVFHVEIREVQHHRTHKRGDRPGGGKGGAQRQVYVHTLHEMERSVALLCGWAWVAGVSNSLDRLRATRRRLALVLALALPRAHDAGQGCVRRVSWKDSDDFAGVAKHPVFF